MESTEYRVFGRMRLALWRSRREAEDVSLGEGTPRLVNNEESLYGRVARGSCSGTVRGGVIRGLERDAWEF